MTLLLGLIAIALTFDFLNGRNDAANSIATIVSTRVLSPRNAVAWAAFFNFVAFLVFGLHVANTIGRGIVAPSVISDQVILGALVGAIAWQAAAGYLGIPSSSSHALIGGLIGAGVARVGIGAIVWSGVSKTVVAIALSPLTGLAIALLLMLGVSWAFLKAVPARVDGLFRHIQFVSASLYSLGHGGNDAQKTMGIIAALLSAHGQLTARWLADRSYDGFAHHAAFARAGGVCGDSRLDHALHRDRAGHPGLNDPHDYRCDCGCGRCAACLRRALECGSAHRYRLGHHNPGGRDHRCRGLLDRSRPQLRRSP
jgi:phosphate/sulfate permease